MPRQCAFACACQRKHSNPCFNWIEHRSSEPEVEGSSLFGHTISYLENKLGDRSLDRFNSIDEQRNCSVLIANTLIIISYHELSRVDLQSHSCYARRDEKDSEVNHMAKKEILDRLSIYVPQKKLKERPVERLPWQCKRDPALPVLSLC